MTPSVAAPGDTNPSDPTGKGEGCHHRKHDVVASEAAMYIYFDDMSRDGRSFRGYARLNLE